MSELNHSYRDFCSSHYHIALALEGNAEIPENARRQVCSLIHYLCTHYKCKLLWARAFSDGVHFLFNLNPDIALAECIRIFKNLTETWIVDGNVKQVNQEPLIKNMNGWSEGFYVRPIHPTDSSLTIKLIKGLSESYTIHRLATQCGLSHYSHSKTVPKIGCHHIRFETVRKLMCLNLKFGNLLIERICNLAKDIDCEVYSASIRREHVHILANIDPNKSLRQFVETIKQGTEKWMKGNIHFHRFEGWDYLFYANTVSAERFSNEDKEVCTQDVIHPFHQYNSELLRTCYIMGWYPYDSAESRNIPCNYII